MTNSCNSMNKNNTTEIAPEGIKENTEIFYLPHHEVIKTESLSTMVRVIFALTDHLS